MKTVVPGRTRRRKVGQKATVTLLLRHTVPFILLLTIVQQLAIASPQLLEPERDSSFPSRGANSTRFPTRTSIPIQPTTESTVESPTLVIPPPPPPPPPSPTTTDKGGTFGGNSGNIPTPIAGGIPLVTNTVIVIPTREASKTTTAKLFVTDDGPNPTNEANPNDQASVSSTPATNSSLLSTVNVTTLAIVVPVVVVLAIAGIWVVRKWKLSPSRRFEEKFENRFRGPRTAASDTVFLRELNA